MNIVTKYDVGATVWVVAKKPESVHETCGCCNSTGIMTIDGEPLRCPKCQGRKTLTGVVKTVALSMVVEQINVGVTANGTKIRYSGSRDDGKDATLLEADTYATKALAEASFA